MTTITSGELAKDLLTATPTITITRSKKGITITKAIQTCNATVTTTYSILNDELESSIIDYTDDSKTKTKITIQPSIDVLDEWNDDDVMSNKKVKELILDSDVQASLELTLADLLANFQEA